MPNGLGFSITLDWPNIIANINIIWIGVLMIFAIVWHALTGGRRPRV